ncbi:ABC transporter ATP-binding protein [Thermoproteus tenax]|uniref:ABC-type antimicrobial peptide transport system, ATP-binding protein n=1 Tax=Thermoproteus tenax (strain ATCC 35583 / DSM 2078 / JCM 9277 / NBRC 100435 / Kra 1) TaxID=768679 RepID=G4RPC0_THETK|nr:ABC-type antimicrobial peptide transport system, ATP-binding protein [Thermoproteus tenax Kra 1]
MIAIDLEDVHKIYKTPAGEVHALKGVTLKIPKSTITAFMGPSGSGKTTLLNIISSLDRPTRGRAIVLGRDVATLGERELERFRLLNIGYLFQSYNLVPYLTAQQNVELPMLAAGVPRDLAKIKARLLLKLVGLEDSLHKYPVQLSGGMQQRAALARALANSPELLILDEPTSNIDLENASAILSLILALNKVWGTTVVMATHDPDVAAIADKVYTVRGGLVIDGEMPRREIKLDIERAKEIYEKIKAIDSTWREQ